MPMSSDRARCWSRWPTKSRRSTRADPVMAAFLSFLAQDISGTPARVKPLGATRIAEARELTKGVTVDDSETLPDDVGL